MQALGGEQDGCIELFSQDNGVEVGFEMVQRPLIDGFINRVVMEITHAGEHAGHAVVEFAGSSTSGVSGKRHRAGGLVQVMGGIVMGVAVVGCDAGNRVPEASDVAESGQVVVQPDTEVTDDQFRSGLADRFGERRIRRAIGIMMNEHPAFRVLMDEDFVECGARRFRDVYKGEHGCQKGKNGRAWRPAALW